MSPQIRKFSLAVHLTASVGWIGAVVAYLALGVTAVTSRDTQTIRAVWTAMELTGWYVIVPLALASLLTGVIMAFGTTWGLLRHYWVMFSLVLTLFAVIILVLHMPTVSAVADAAQAAGPAQLDQFGGDLFHAGFGLVLLLVIQVLNVYKPRGLTPYGRRKQAERHPRSSQQK